MITRRMLTAAAAALPFAARAQGGYQGAYPSRPIQIVNPYPPGNSTDLLARALAAELSPRLGQPVVVMNRDGAAGAVGSAAVARAAPDGHTLLFVPALVASVLPVTQATSGLQRNSFRPICQAFNNTMALSVRPDSPIRDLRDLAATAKRQRLTYGTLGITSIPHLAMVQWMHAAGIEIEHVPFRSDASVLTEVLTARLDVGAIVLASAAGRGDVRLLTVFDTERHPDFPDVPTAMEQGFDVAPASFGGLFAPAATPQDRIARLEAACTEAVASASYRAVARSGAQPANVFLDGGAFARRIQDDVDRKAAILRGITLN